MFIDRSPRGAKIGAMHIRTAAAVLLLVPVLAQADVYRWVDASGQVHYSEEVPAPYTGERIDTPPPPPVSANPHLDQVKNYASASAKARQKQEEEGTKAREEKQQAKVRCDAARGRQAFFNDQRRIAMPDGNGGYRTMSDDEYEKELKENDRAVAEHCRTG